MQAKISYNTILFLKGARPSLAPFFPVVHSLVRVERRGMPQIKKKIIIINKAKKEKKKKKLCRARGAAASRALARHGSRAVRTKNQVSCCEKQQY